MPWFNSYPYTSFRAVNSKDGRTRLQDGAYGLRLEIAGSTLTADRKVYLGDGSGTLVVRGYHVVYGTTTFQRNSLIAADTLYTGTCAITGLLATSQLFFTSLYGINSSGAATGPLALGGRYSAAGVANVALYNLAATTSTGATVVDYLLLHPQTS